MRCHQPAGGSEGEVPGAQAEDATGGIGARVEQLQSGQRVKARVHGVAHWTGTVETVAVPLDVVWIREDGLGERKLLDLREYQVHPQDLDDGWSRPIDPHKTLVAGAPVRLNCSRPGRP